MPFPVQCAVTLRVNTSELPGRAEAFSSFLVIQFKQRCHSICSLKLFPTQISQFRIDVEEAGRGSIPHMSPVFLLGHWGKWEEGVKCCNVQKAASAIPGSFNSCNNLAR